METSITRCAVLYYKQTCENLNNCICIQNVSGKLMCVLFWYAPVWIIQSHARENLFSIINNENTHKLLIAFSIYIMIMEKPTITPSSLSTKKWINSAVRRNIADSWNSHTAYGLLQPNRHRHTDPLYLTGATSIRTQRKLCHKM